MEPTANCSPDVSRGHPPNMSPYGTPGISNASGIQRANTGLAWHGGLYALPRQRANTGQNVGTAASRSQNTGPSKPQIRMVHGSPPPVIQSNGAGRQCAPSTNAPMTPRLPVGMATTKMVVASRLPFSSPAQTPATPMVPFGSSANVTPAVPIATLGSPRLAITQSTTFAPTACLGSTIRGRTNIAGRWPPAVSVQATSPQPSSSQQTQTPRTNVATPNTNITSTAHPLPRSAFPTNAGASPVTTFVSGMSAAPPAEPVAAVAPREEPKPTQQARKMTMGDDFESEAFGQTAVMDAAAYRNLEANREDQRAQAAANTHAAARGIAMEPPNQATAKGASNSAHTALFVDCGSGRTRAKVFVPKGEGVIQVEAGKYCSLDEWRESAIVAILQEGARGVQRWVEALRTLAERCSCDHVIVGATGGLRNALSNGEVTPAMLDDLRKSFKQNAPAVVFKEFSKEQEAEAELSAVQYVASLALPSQASKPVGLISGGGMSCQVAYYANSASSPSFLSLDADMRSTSDKMVGENVSVASVLAEFEARLKLLVSDTGLSAKLTGMFCVIEMLGYLGESKSQFPELAALSLGNQLLNKAEVFRALQTHLEDWMGRNQSVSDYDVAYTGLLPKCLLGLLDLFDDNARFFISREWEVGPDTKIKPDWSLGVYARECLQPRQQQTTFPTSNVTHAAHSTKRRSSWDAVKNQFNIAGFTQISGEQSSQFFNGRQFYRIVQAAHSPGAPMLQPCASVPAIQRTTVGTTVAGATSPRVIRSNVLGRVMIPSTFASPAVTPMVPVGSPRTQTVVTSGPYSHQQSNSMPPMVRPPQTIMVISSPKATQRQVISATANNAVSSAANPFMPGTAKATPTAALESAGSANVRSASEPAWASKLEPTKKWAKVEPAYLKAGQGYFGEGAGLGNDLGDQEAKRMDARASRAKSATTHGIPGFGKQAEIDPVAMTAIKNREAGETINDAIKRHESKRRTQETAGDITETERRSSRPPPPKRKMSLGEDETKEAMGETQSIDMAEMRSRQSGARRHDTRLDRAKQAMAAAKGKTVQQVEEEERSKKEVARDLKQALQRRSNGTMPL